MSKTNRFFLIYILLSCLFITSCRTIPNIPIGTIHSFPTRASSKENLNPSKQVRTSTAISGIGKYHDPFPDRNGHTHTIAGDALLANNSIFVQQQLKNYSKHITISDSSPKNCDLVDKKKVYLDQSDSSEYYFKIIAGELYSNHVHVLTNKVIDNFLMLEADFYNCAFLKQRENPTLSILSNIDTTEIDMMMGRFVERNGFLKNLGETGPTMALNIHFYNPATSKKFAQGFYLHFSFDHFFDTDSSLLKPKFTDEDFTNYLWSAGYTARYFINTNIQLNYSIGPAINFLEIDTNRTNQELTDDEATRTSFSLIHQFGVSYRVKNNLRYNNFIKFDHLIGINFLSYWLPDPLGDFANSNLPYKSYSGGSTAILLSWKIQSI